VVVSVGAGVLAVSAMFSLAGLPAPAEIAHGAGDVPSPATSPSAPPASDVPGPLPIAESAPVKRHALAEADLCQRGPRTMPPAAVAYHGARDVKVVALTFDDGWGGRSLRKILRILQERHVNATFFPVGQAVRHDPETWRKVAAAGYPIADHTYDHGELKGMCYSEQRIELSRARHTYESILGIQPFPAMRPPGGFFDEATLAAATAAGEPTLVLWDVDSHDWMGIGFRQVRANALAGKKGSIVVLHTSSFATVRALPGIIRGYRQRGYEFVTIGQLLGIPGAVPYPAE
jgi:peptidoglycan/xylan/chitin deacetylase (PgdA/CDA1 family)